MTIWFSRDSIGEIRIHNPMEKPAKTDHQIDELLDRRWSPFVFDPKPVPQPVLDRMFEAARWAASSYNEQPWRYILGVRAVNHAQFDRLASVLFPGNAWAKDAPMLALSLAKKTFSHSGEPNRVAVHDVGAASASFTLQGLKDGVFVHQMGGFDVAQAADLFKVPEEFQPVAMIAFGYPGDPERLPEATKARQLEPRTRKKIEEFVFTGDFGETSA